MGDKELTDPIQALQSLQDTLQLRWYTEDMKYMLARQYWHYLEAIYYSPLVLERFAAHSSINGEWGIAD